MKDKRQMNGAFTVGSTKAVYSPLNITWETKKMIRYTLFVLTTVGFAATALASIKPADQYAIANPKTVSVFYKNDIYPMIDGQIVEKCAVENCSDTPSNS
jgi:hypothetical protein